MLVNGEPYPTWVASTERPSIQSAWPEGKAIDEKHPAVIGGVAVGAQAGGVTEPGQSGEPVNDGTQGLPLVQLEP